MSVNVGQVWGSRSRDYECVNNPEVVRRILSLVSLRKEGVSLAKAYSCQLFLCFSNHKYSAQFTLF